MRVQHLARAMVLVASLVALAEQVIAIELGELQAVPSSYPPYIFRLAIVASPLGSPGSPAVTVRQPHDALSFVKNNLLELRLGSLSDVELEISQGSQTLNRLLLKSELQAARAQLGTTIASPRLPSAIAKDRETAPAGAKPLTPATLSAPDRALLERELQVIRQEIQSLVGRVSPWEGLSTPPWHTDHGVAALAFMLMLGGLFIAGVTSLFTGYLMHRSAVDREQQLRRARGELTSKAPPLPVVRGGQLYGDRHERLEPVTVLRRVWVSQKTRRRVRIRTSRAAPQEDAPAHTQVIARVSHPQLTAPAEIVEALVNLRCELMRLQRRLPPSTTPTRPISHRGPL
jgi:hypothetical protein